MNDAGHAGRACFEAYDGGAHQPALGQGLAPQQPLRRAEGPGSRLDPVEDPAPRAAHPAGPGRAAAGRPVGACTGSLRPGPPERDAAGVVHALLSPEVCRLLVVDRRWSPVRHEQWLVGLREHELLRPAAPRS